MTALKHILHDAWLNIAELLLFLVGFCFVFPILSIVGFIYSFIKHAFVKFDYSAKKHFKPLVRILNLISDCAANGLAGELLNDVLGIKGKIRYGSWRQTISAVSGLIHIYEKDTFLRRALDIVPDHCEKAITPEDAFYWKYHHDENDKKDDSILPKSLKSLRELDLSGMDEIKDLGRNPDK